MITEIFAKTEEELSELEVKHNLEDCGMSGRYPEMHWLQDDKASVAVYYNSKIFEN
jgi:hypothetical protein